MTDSRTSQPCSNHPDGETRVLLDPNAVRGWQQLFPGLSISEDGKLMAYGLSTAGSDWQEWKVRDVEKCEDLPSEMD